MSFAHAVDDACTLQTRKPALNESHVISVMLGGRGISAFASLELAMTARPGMPWPDGSRLVDTRGVVRAVLVPWVGGGAWCHVFEKGGAK